MVGPGPLGHPAHSHGPFGPGNDRLV